MSTWETVEHEEEDTQRDKYLIFSLDHQHYGIDIQNVTEIIGIQPIAAVPELPTYIKGIINLRGTVIPVMDIRLRFGMEPKAYHDRTCIIVVECEDTIMGLIVDRVSEVISIPGENVISAQDGGFEGGGYVTGVGKSAGGGMKMLVSCSKLLDGEYMPQNRRTGENGV
ncbi:MULTISPECIES: chemotaxis protein CheW [Paenibacillus]|uniref:chemotaxis protein CheW n=1 Tax=Paenibacillus TaxID=44249 RepID=UPI001CC73793|nr:MULTISPECIES: chemotaxis protein CheW [Paenibacillus]